MIRFHLVWIALSSATVCSAGQWSEVVGKFFDVDAPAKTSRFLKQDVTYDAKTGKGKAWYTIRWTDSTSITSKTRIADFQGMKDPVKVKVNGITKREMEKLKADKPFVANSVFVYLNGDVAGGLDEAAGTAVGTFTADHSGDFRSGSLIIDGKAVKLNLRRGGKRVVIFKPLDSTVLTKGRWKATVSGIETKGGEVLVHRIRVEPLVNPSDVDAPKLPRVLSVGDSISINYMASARDELKGIANYHRIEDNCWSTRRGKAFMAYWLGDYTRQGLGWDVILFNSGMHDLKQKKLGGPYAVPLDEYKKNLRKEIEIMKPTGATLIFCTTTPVPNDLGNEQYAFRSKGSEKDFNAAALELLKEFPEIRILDLAKVVNESAAMDNWRKGKDVHYWKKEEQAVLGAAVAEAVKVVLKSKD